MLVALFLPLPLPEGTPHPRSQPPHAHPRKHFGQATVPGGVLGETRRLLSARVPVQHAPTRLAPGVT